jgi:hypothetical protein
MISYRFFLIRQQILIPYRKLCGAKGHIERNLVGFFIFIGAKAYALALF